ncbi:MAG TPA: anthranilate phosphoribosyltransferase [Mycobacteriales bacterium]|nr:anthranilate phosphoribosyltransferase [Mycobacteriales bacterium]
MSWPTILSTLLAKTDLPASDATWAMREIIDGNAPSATIAAFLVGLRAKGESVTELSAMADCCMEKAVPLRIPGEFIDIVGTGGDRSGLANVSTMSAIVVAALGITVVKHGGRGASTRSGAADTLEELRIPLELPPDEVRRIAADAGITFCFAPAFHPGMRHAAPVRRELGVPTALNYLAPLLNPARPPRQLIGVSSRAHAPLIAAVLARRGTDGLVVHGDDGIDKVSTHAPSTFWEIRGGRVPTGRIDPREFGIAPPADPAALRSRDARDGARIIRRVLAGEPGPLRDSVRLNAAAALWAAGAGPDLAENLRRCTEAIDSGAASVRLDRWIAAI